MPIYTWDMMTILLIITTIFLATLLLALSEHSQVKANKKHSKFLAFLSFFLVVSIAGFQKSNADFDSYYEIYRTMNLSDGFIFHEVGFKLLVVSLRSLGFPPQAIFVFMSGITYSFFYKAVIQYTRRCNVPIASISTLLFAFYFLVSFGMLRQIAAASILFFAYYYLAKFDYKKYIGLVLLATSFHITALFGFAIMIFYYLIQFSLPPFFWVKKFDLLEVKTKTKLYKFLTFLWIIALYAFIYFLPWLLSKVNLGRDYSAQILSEPIGLGFFLHVPIVVSLWVMLKKTPDVVSEVKCMVFIVFFNALLSIGYYMIPVMSGRIIYFIGGCMCVIIPYFLKHFIFKDSKKADIMTIIISIIISGVYFLYQLLTTPWITRYLMPIKFI